ncbi:MAG: hypothetical protein HYU64_17910 [Armatimonadetes bacterium]|nr:hypothetical protein [Armatimonadota bacterium]
MSRVFKSVQMQGPPVTIQVGANVFVPDIHPRSSDEKWTVGGDFPEGELKAFPDLSDGMSSSSNQHVHEAEQEAQAIVDQAQGEAQAIREQAAREGDQILEQARSDGEEIREQARAAGRTEGLETGREEGKQEVLAHLSALLNSMRQIHDRTRIAQTAAYEGQEMEILELAVEIAEKVVRAELTVNKEVVHSVVKAALRKASNKENMVIRVSPSDLRNVLKHKEELAILENLDHFNILEDPRITEGGCLISTSAGEIDGRVETQLDEIRRALYLSKDLM